MGKTIMKRAKAVFHDLIHEYEDEISIVIIATALDKAEKRGRTIGRIEAVMDSYFLTDAADLLCNTVSSISKDEQIRVLSEQIDFMEDQIEELEKQPEQKFDTDEAKRLIMLLGYAFNKYLQSKSKCNKIAHDEWLSIRNELYSILGIEE